MLNIYDVVS
jgi:hypothetical protein